jgi:hypothetical protein
MTELLHPQPQAMGTGLLHAASLTATIAVVVDRFFPFQRRDGNARAQPGSVVDPTRAAYALPELEKEPQ